MAWRHLVILTSSLAKEFEIVRTWWSGGELGPINSRQQQHCPRNELYIGYQR